MAFGKQHGPGLYVVEMEFILILTVGGIKRGCRGRLRDGEKGRCHFRAIWQNDHHKVTGINAYRLQARGDLVGQVPQCIIAQSWAAHSPDGRQRASMIGNE